MITAFIVIGFCIGVIAAFVAADDFVTGLVIVLQTAGYGLLLGVMVQEFVWIKEMHAVIVSR